jgi:hypothetical protein
LYKHEKVKPGGSNHRLQDIVKKGRSKKPGRVAQNNCTIRYLSSTAKIKESVREIIDRKSGNLYVLNLIVNRYPIAIGELKVAMYEFNYHEFLSCHKIDGHRITINNMLSDLNL